MAGGVEYQVTKVDPTNPETKGMVYQVHKVTEEVAATLGGKVYRARIINDPTEPTVAGKVYQIVLIGDPDDPAVKGKVYNAILTGGSEAVVVGPAVSPLALDDAVADTLSYVKAFGGTELRKLPSGYTQVAYIYFLASSYLTTDINPSYDGRYEFDFQTTTLGSSGATTYLGVRPSSSGNGGLRVARISIQVFRVYGFGAYQDSTITAASNTRYKFVWDNQHAVMTSGGSTVLDLTYTGTDACAYPITINGWNSAGTVTPGSEGIFVYSFKAWNAQGELVADYVPTKDPDGVVGFYDMVSESFKTATAGTIAAGPDAAPIPTPDAPVDIVSNNGVLKYSPNELNPSDIEIGYYRVAGTGELTESPYNFITGYMPVKPGQGYVFFGRRQDDNRLSSYNRIHWFNANKEFISTNSYTKDTIGTGVAPSNAYFAQCSCNESGAASRVTTQEIVDGYNWVFQQGAAEVPYIPYVVEGGLYTDGTVETIEDTIGNTATAEMLLKVGDYQDEQEILSGVVTRNVGVLVLDGTEPWAYQSGTSAYISLGDAKANSIGVCTHLIGNNSATAGTIRFTSVIRVYGIGSLWADLAEFKQWLTDQYNAGTPVIVIYPLAEPTTESVAGQALQVTDGDNTLEITQASIDGLELEAEYEKEAA